MKTKIIECYDGPYKYTLVYPDGHLEIWRHANYEPLFFYRLLDGDTIKSFTVEREVPSEKSSISEKSTNG